MFKNSIKSAVMRVIKARLEGAQKAFDAEEKVLVQSYNENVERENEAHAQTLDGFKKNLDLDRSDLLGKHVNAVLEKAI